MLCVELVQSMSALLLLALLLLHLWLMLVS
jgi:hypothetical protein